jgi:hypothetical protein
MVAVMGWALWCTPTQRQRNHLSKHIINTMLSLNGKWLHDYIYLKEYIPPVKRGVTNFRNFYTLRPTDLLFYLDILVDIIPCCIFVDYHPFGGKCMVKINSSWKRLWSRVCVPFYRDSAFTLISKSQRGVFDHVGIYLLKPISAMATFMLR